MSSGLDFLYLTEMETLPSYGQTWRWLRTRCQAAPAAAAAVAGIQKRPTLMRPVRGGPAASHAETD